MRGAPVGPGNAYDEFARSEVEQSIVCRFEKQVAAHGDRLALKTAQRSLTYAELNQHANRIAHSVRRRSGSAPVAVALLFAHDAPLISAILAVLKTGRFYVVLDASNPAERSRAIMAHAQADLLLTDARHLAAAQEIAAPDCAVMNSDALEEDLPQENLRHTVDPSSLAYLIYTSGSTGEPKGVCQTHRNVLHHIRKYTNACHICPQDRLSLLTSCAFGASVSNLFGALLNGAALFPFAVRNEGPRALADWLQGEKISLYHSVPLVFRRLAESLHPNESFPFLRLIKLGGEAITRRDFDLFRRHFGRHSLMYVGLGSSEMNAVRGWFLDEASDFEGPIAPVGFALEDTDVLLLDEALREVPAGETGEIAVRSPYLFRGYWRRPDLDAATFIADPNGGGVRVFRTGDLGRMQPGGLLQHLGRNEFQIKIRGARVEPAEVEHALHDEAEIRDCLVLAKKVREETQLIAFLTNGSGPRPDAATLQARLRQRLPDYMVPARFVWVPEWPVRNGKIDRNALLQIEEAAQTEYVAPRDDLERQLVEIWQCVLRHERIGIHHNFFELGGDSLAAAQIEAEIENRLGFKVPVPTVFWAPSIDALARQLRPNATAALSSLVPLSSAGSELPLFIIHGWGGDVHFYGELAKLLPEQPVYGLQAVGLDGKAPRHSRVEDMARHYLDEIRTVQPRGPYHILGFSLGSLIALEVAQQAFERGERVDFLALLDPPARPAPWLPYARTIAPLLAQSARYHLTHWVRTGESFHFKRRLKRLRRWIDRNKPREPSVLASPECSSTPPVIDGFKDYYAAVSFPYQLRRYPGTIDVIVGDSAAAALLPLWRHIAKGGARYHRVSCTHREMVQREFLPPLAIALRSALATARSKRPASG